MSNHWDLRCLTCEMDCDLDWNNGGDQIQQLIPLLPNIAKMRPVQDILSSRFTEFGFHHDLLGFAERHHTHDLIAVDEYGVLHGNCVHCYECACCKTRQPCQLSRDHEGDHGPLPEDGAS